jgi:hypothetical protein
VGAEVPSKCLERSQGYCLLSLSLFIGTQLKMTDMNTIRVISFYGKVDEWPIWSERFLAKSRRFGFKDLLLGKLSIPTVDEKFDEGTESGNKKSIAIEMNKIAYTELILSIDVKTSSGKVTFNLIKGCKSKDYPDGNAAIAWERIKKKYEPISAPSLVNLEKQFRELSLKKGQDPEIWITESEDLRVRLEAMGSSISENQFMIHILNNLTSDYELQLALMERRVGDDEKPLMIEEIRGELSLRFKRMIMKSLSNKEVEGLEENAFLVDSLKESAVIVDKSGTSRSNARIEDLIMVEITVTQVAVIFVRIFANPAMRRRTVSTSRREIHDPTMPVRITVMPNGPISTHKM